MTEKKNFHMKWPEKGINSDLFLFHLIRVFLAKTASFKDAILEIDDAFSA